MNTVANTPLPGIVTDHSAQPPATGTAVTSQPHTLTPHRVMDTLVLIYAYGLLGFGLLFPFVLAAWTLYYGAPGR